MMPDASTEFILPKKDQLSLEKLYEENYEKNQKAPAIKYNKPSKSNSLPKLTTSKLKFKRRGQSQRRKADATVEDFLLLLKHVEDCVMDEVTKTHVDYPHLFWRRDVNGDTLLHLATKCGHMEMVQFLVEVVGMDVNQLSKSDKNAAIHFAVQNDHLLLIDYLMNHGARTNILNAREMAPIHIAVEYDHVDALEQLLKHPKIDVDLPGNNEAPALQIAAANNYIDCLELLLAKGASPCKCNGSGLTAIHVAAKAGSREITELLIQSAVKLGFDHSSIMEMGDRDGNVPLHAAVDSGNAEVVRVCLLAGANIDAQQEDLSTPVHFACTRNEIEILKLMLEMQPAKKKRVLNLRDYNGMTPLLNAVALNHDAIVNYLLTEGADKETKDTHDRTALLVAAACAAGRVLSLLIRRGANLFHHDVNQQNFVHLAVINRTSFEHFLSDPSEVFYNGALADALTTLLNERDKHGSTPLHYASGDGLLQTIEHLLVAGAEVTVRNNNRDTALHFAARRGRYNSCCRLLDNPHSQFIINVQDHNGCSPLFVAAENGHARTVNLLLSTGALFHRNNAGLTVLHAAAMNGHKSTVELLLKANKTLLDAQGGCGNTAMHLAARNGHEEVVLLLMNLGAQFTLNADEKSFFTEAIFSGQEKVVSAVLRHRRWEEAMMAFTRKYGSPINNLIALMPRAYLIVLDNSYRTNKKAPKHLDYAEIFNLQFVEPTRRMLKLINATGGEQIGPLPSLNLMVKHNRLELLSHPCSQAVIKMKMKAYGKLLFGLELFMTILALASITYLASSASTFCEVDSIDKYTKECSSSWLSKSASASASNFEVSVNSNGSSNEEKYDCASRGEIFQRNCYQTNSLRSTLAYFFMIYVFYGMVSSAYGIYRQKWAYFQDNLDVFITRYAMFFFSLMYLLPCSISGNFSIMTHEQSIARILAMSCCWFHFFLTIQVDDSLGLYVVMFSEIVKTLLKASLVFGILICGFGLTFHVLLRQTTNSGRLIASNLRSATANTNPQFQFQTQTQNQAQAKPRNKPAGIIALSAFGTPTMSMFKTLLMMTGELNYIDTFMMPYEDEQIETLHFPILTFPIVFFFVICVPIVIMNLMLGLALGNIEAVKKNSDMKKLCMQVKLLTNLERNVPNWILQFFPDYLMYEVRPNQSTFSIRSILQFIYSILNRKKTSNVTVQFSTRRRDARVARADGFESEIGDVKQFKKGEIAGLLERQSQILRSLMRHLDIGAADLEEMEDEVHLSYLGSRTKAFKQSLSTLNNSFKSKRRY